MLRYLNRSTYEDKKYYDNNNLKKPKVLLDAKSSIEQLLNSKFYNKDIPICLLPNTDPFLDKTNIEYLKQLLFLIKTSNINNPITIIDSFLFSLNIFFNIFTSLFFPILSKTK